MIFDTPRYDLLIAPARSDFRTSEHGLKALFRYIVMSQLLVEDHHTEGEGWVEISLRPGHFAHHLFIEGERPAIDPVVKKMVVRSGTAPGSLAYGEPGRKSWFWLELIGSGFNHINQDFVDRLQQILYMRPQVYVQPHVPTPARALKQTATQSDSPIGSHSSLITTTEIDLDEPR